MTIVHISKLVVKTHVNRNLLPVLTLCSRVQRNHVREWSRRYNYRVPQARIPLLEGLKVRRVLESAPVCVGALVPVQPPEPRMQARVVRANRTDVAAEERVIRRVESNQRHIQPHIRLGDVCPEEVRLVRGL
jgi:hypothetical protein